MKVSKKAVAIIVIFSIVLSYSIGIVVFYMTRPNISFTVMTDLHLMSEDIIVDDDSPSFQNGVYGGQKMVNISEAILKTSIDKFIDSKNEILLIPGDVTDNGCRLSHITVANELKRAEASGKKVYIMPGNHDINRNSRMHGGEVPVTVDNISPEDFEEIYNDFGYSEAVRKHSDTLSYSANLNKKYRLIVIDSAYYEKTEGYDYCKGLQNTPNMTEDTLNWCVNEIEQAINDKMIPIAMTHYPVLEHLGSFMSSLSLTDHAYVNDRANVANRLIGAGLKYIFTGHMHAQNIASLEIGGKTLFDIQTGSLSSYPAPIREVKMYKEKLVTTTGYLDYVNENYLPDYLNNDKKQEILNDFTLYKKYYLNEDFVHGIMKDLDAETISSLISLLIDTDDTEGVEALSIDIQENLIRKFLTMPLYNTSNELSIEGICSEYGVELPSSEYISVIDLVMTLFKANSYGDEDFQSNSIEMQLIKYSIFSVFYVIDDFELFSKLNTLDDSLEAIDLSNTIKMLFAQEKLDIIDNGLLELILTIDLLSEVLPFSVSGSAGNVLTLANFYLESNDIMGIDFSPYIDSDGGYLLLGNLIDEIVYGIVGEELLNDPPPPDNNVTLYPDGTWK